MKKQLKKYLWAKLAIKYSVMKVALLSISLLIFCGCSTGGNASIKPGESTSSRDITNIDGRSSDESYFRIWYFPTKDKDGEPINIDIPDGIGLDMRGTK